ncbi:MAG: RnfABCDGE type electron transport complex subunit C [bacterium]|nr:RnfABCDGE type electron transport complex subunit C [bacterium]
MSVSFSGGIPLRAIRDKVRTFESKPVMSCPKHYYPLAGKNGIIYTPLVKAGDTVALGQKIAHTADSWELPLHSSVSGSVIGIEDYPAVSGSVKTIVISNDELYTPIDNPGIISDYKNADKKDIIIALQNSGIADMNGGEFLCGEALLSQPPKYLIVNAVDSEPYTAAASRRIAENAEEVIEGIRILQYLIGIKTVYIAVESNFSDGINAVTGAVRYDETLNIIKVKPKYPQQNKHMLVKAVAGRNIPYAKTPSDVGCMVTTPEVLYHISRTLKTGIPVTEQIVTVAGNALSSPENFRVPFGVPISFLISETNTLSEVPDRIIVNGIMNGEAQTSADTVTAKDIHSIQLFKNSEKLSPVKQKKCIHCGLCVSHCPARLVPFMINKASLDYKPGKAMKYHILDCIRCGTCSYVCPSCIPLSKNIGDMMDSIQRLYRKEYTNE